jgi:hypothetical protein
MQKTNLTIVAVALTTLLATAGMTEAQSIVTYDSSGEVVWIEHESVSYSNEYNSVQFVETEILSPIASEASPNPIIEVSPEEYFSTAAKTVKPAKTVALPLAHSTKTTKQAKSATPVAAVTVQAKTVEPEPLVSNPASATTQIIEPTYSQPTTLYYPTATPVCMSGG